MNLTGSIYHSVQDDFKDVLKNHLAGGRDAIVALGPIYEHDPAGNLLAPFYRSAKEVGIEPQREWLAPQWAIEQARDARLQIVELWASTASERDRLDVVDWTRAGLVLEISSWLGIPMRHGAKVFPKWKLRGTVTGRFGIENGSFNPLTIPRDQRDRIVPDGSGRDIVVLDFRAMDLCSIISLFPGLADRYRGTADPHQTTADLVGVDREVAKKELFVFAYGGHSSYHREFSERLPELVPVRGPELARRVQETSALAFRAGLSAALPLLFGGHIRPMFTVHDELVLDRETGHDVGPVIRAMERGASERIGVPYSVGMKTGSNYAEAKRE